MLAPSLWRPLCAALLIPLVCAQKHRLVHRAVTSSTSSNRAAPTPLSVAASSIWDGPDGPWSSFWIRVGTPEQTLRVLISTASKETWVVLPEGCLRTDTICPDARGRIYNNNTSSTWSRLGGGYFELSVEQNLNSSVIGFYGRDTLGLGGQGSSGPSLPDQIIAGIGNELYYLGMLGVNRKPTDFGGVDGEKPSYIASLKAQGIIPSESFGYTAGAQYQLRKVLGSLTLGGYDESRFTPNELSFPFASGDSRDLVVGVQSITSTSRNGGAVKSLLPSGILASVDSTVPQIWLPIDACRAFEEAFGLVYDEKSKLYPVNDTLHNALIAQNAVITFTLGNLQTGGKTINITLPYDSFDLQATPPFVGTRTRYFPLQRAKDNTQYTLGRTFLQEAYLIVDWERGNFSLSQCLFKEDSPQRLVAIASASRSSDRSTINNSSSFSNGQKIGVGVGVSLGVIVAGILIFFFLRRRNRPKKHKEIEKPEDDPVELPRPTQEKAELNADNENAIHEKGDYENKQRREQPKVLASPRSWDANDETVAGGTLAGELSADQANQGLSPSEPLLGQVHELQDRAGSPANPHELSTETRSELPGLPPDNIKHALAAAPPDPSPISQSSSSAPSDPTHGHLDPRRGARSSARKSPFTPSRPRRPLGAPTSN